MSLDQGAQWEDLAYAKAWDSNFHIEGAVKCILA